MKEKLQFADRLSELMLKHGGLNAHQLSKVVGLSHVTIGNYLVGKPPKSLHLVSIAQYFHVSTDWLLGLRGEGMYDEKGGIKPGFETGMVLNDAPPKKEIARLTKIADGLADQLSELRKTIKELEP